MLKLCVELLLCGRNTSFTQFCYKELSLSPEPESLNRTQIDSPKHARLFKNSLVRYIDRSLSIYICSEKRN